MPLRGRENKTLLIAPRQTAARAVPAPAAPSPVCLSVCLSVRPSWDCSLLFCADLQSLAEPLADSCPCRPPALRGAPGGHRGCPPPPAPGDLAQGRPTPRGKVRCRPRSSVPLGTGGLLISPPCPDSGLKTGGQDLTPAAGPDPAQSLRLRGTSPFPAPRAGVSHLPIAGKRAPFIFSSFSFPHFFPSPTENPRRGPGEPVHGR